MATTLTASVSAAVSWSYANVLAWGNATNSSNYSYSSSLSNGTGADQSDKIYITESTLAGGATLNLDLAAALTDIFGTTITFARVKTIYFQLLTTTTSTGVSVGGHATAAFVNWVADATDKVNVRNGGVLLLHAPDSTAYAVTATTADMLTLTNTDGSNVATYRLVIVGASA